MRTASLVAIAGVLAAAGAAGAQFNPAQWTFSAGGGGGFGSLTPSKMFISGNNSGGINIDTTYTAAAGTQSGPLQFTTSYFSMDSGTYDYAFYSINGVKTIIHYNDPGPYVLNHSIIVPAGAVFAFGVTSVDGALGPGELTVTNYIPAPSSLALLGLGGLVAGRRRRRCADFEIAATLTHAEARRAQRRRKRFTTESTEGHGGATAQ